MDFSSIIYSLGAIGIFPSRAFMPAFVTALILRFGPQISWLAGVGIIPKAPVHHWFTSTPCLVILGVLTVLELVATKDSDIRQFMDEIDHWLKAGVALLTTLGVVSATDAKTLQAIQQAGMGGTSLLAGAVALGTFMVADARRCLLNFLVEADHDDSLGLQHALAWLEDFWVLGILLLLFVFPLVALLLLGVAMVALESLRRLAKWREEREKIACPGCQTLIYPCARSCPECQQPNPAPCAVGFLGGSLVGVSADPATQAFRLLEKMRCPECAGRLPKVSAGHVCPACGFRVFADAAAVADYDRFVRARLPKTLLVVFLLGLVPLFGAVLGVLWYRTQVVSPYRRHVPGLRRWWLRILLKIAWFLLLAIQWIPLVGWLSLPAMAWMSHAAYRRAFLQGRH